MSTTAVGLLAQGASKGTYSATTGAFTAYNLLLKQFYEGPTRDLINSTRILVRLVNRDVPGITVSGNEVVSSVRTGRNPGHKYVRELAPLPEAGKQSYNTPKWQTRYNYAACQFSGQVVSSSRNNAGAFLNAMDAEINGMAEDVQHGEQRVLYGNGTGRLARVQAKALPAGNSVFTLEHPGGIPSQALGTQYLEVGDRICFLNSAQETDAIYVTATADWRANTAGTVRSTSILAIDYAAGTITVNGDWDANVAVGDYVYVAQRAEIPAAAFQDAHSNRGIEMNGLNSIISNVNPPLQRPGTDPTPWAGFGNIDVAAEPRWAAFVNDAGGVPRPWDQGLLQLAMDGLAQSGNGVVRIWLTTHGIRRQFAAELVAQRRYPATLNLGGGFRALSYNGIPMVVDKDATRGVVWGLDPTTLTVAKESDWNFIDEDGRVLQRVTGYDAFTVEMRRYAEFVCNLRNRNCKIGDIIDT